MSYFGPCNTDSIESNDTIPEANPILSPFPDAWDAIINNFDLLPFNSQLKHFVLKQT